MSIMIAKEIHCDGCGEWLRVDDYGRIINEAWKQLKKEGWTRYNGKHFCGDCSNKEDK